MIDWLITFTDGTTVVARGASARATDTFLAVGRKHFVVANLRSWEPVS